MTWLPGIDASADHWPARLGRAWAVVREAARRVDEKARGKMAHPDAMRTVTRFRRRRSAPQRPDLILVGRAGARLSTIGA